MNISRQSLEFCVESSTAIIMNTYTYLRTYCMYVSMYVLYVCTYIHTVCTYVQYVRRYTVHTVSDEVELVLKNHSQGQMKFS